MRRLVCFDVSNGRRRNSLVKLCLGAGFRVQKSVFETFLDEKELKAFESSVGRIIDERTDSVRIYPLDGNASRNLSIIGKGKRIEEVAFKIL